MGYLVRGNRWMASERYQVVMDDCYQKGTWWYKQKRFDRGKQYIGTLWIGRNINIH